MLSENKSERQRPGEGIRRWFLDSFFDFILWYDDERRFTGFQLCYEKRQNERAITSKIESGKAIRSHRYVTTNYDAPSAEESHNMTAILRGDAGKLDPAIVTKLETESGDLDPDLKARVSDELKRFV